MLNSSIPWENELNFITVVSNSFLNFEYSPGLLFGSCMRSSDRASSHRWTRKGVNILFVGTPFRGEQILSGSDFLSVFALSISSFGCEKIVSRFNKKKGIVKMEKTHALKFTKYLNWNILP